MKDYHINVFYREDEGYIANIPDLKYCSACGATVEEAVQEVLKAKAAWLETAKAEGKLIPVPKYRPAIESLKFVESEEFDYLENLEDYEDRLARGKIQW